MSMETDIRAKNNEKTINEILERLGMLEERADTVAMYNGDSKPEQKSAAEASKDRDALANELTNVEVGLEARDKTIADLKTELATQKAYIKGLEGKSNPVSLRPPSKGRGRGMSKKVK